jgi:hypothetical protein
VSIGYHGMMGQGGIEMTAKDKFHDWTEENPAEELIKMGVPREDIVLGLQPPYKRPYTAYGVA